MKRTMTLFVATAISVSPAVVFAQSGPPAPGSISPAHETGQQGLECTDEGAVAPGFQSGRDPGPGAPFQADSISGSHYAGEQDGINNKNTASVSQYDIACFRPQH